MSNSAWCDLNSKGDIFNLHDPCSNPKCKCQEEYNFTPNQFQLGGSGFKSTMKEEFRGT